MYCELAMEDVLDAAMEIELPAPVPAATPNHRAEKTLLAELEVCPDNYVTNLTACYWHLQTQVDDIFKWKISKIAANKPVGGYVYGSLKPQETVPASGKRACKLNSTHLC